MTPVSLKSNDSYKQVKISVDSAIAFAFKDACAASNVSMAALISQFMADYSNTALANRKPSPDYSTKRKRRSTIHKIIRQLEQIRGCEEQYRDNIPENLHNAAVFDSSEEFVSYLDTAIDALESIDSI